MEDLNVAAFLQEKYEKLKYDTVTDWMYERKVNLSLQSCTAVLLRGQDKGLIVMLTLAACLDCTPEELQKIAKAKGDRTLWRMIASDNLTREEQELLNDHRQLKPSQKKVINMMIQEMVHETH